MREYDVEVAAPFARATGDDRHVRRREDYHTHGADRVAQPLWLRVSHGHLLPARATVEGRCHLARPLGGLEATLDSKHIVPEPHQLLVRRTAEGAEDLEVVDRFQQIRLPLPVVSDERDALRREIETLIAEVAIPAEVQTGEKHDYGTRLRITDYELQKHAEIASRVSLLSNP